MTLLVLVNRDSRVVGGAEYCPSASLAEDHLKADVGPGHAIFVEEFQHVLAKHGVAFENVATIGLSAREMAGEICTSC